MTDREAVRFRRLAAKARDLLGLTNKNLAKKLGRDPRFITNMFASGRPLRASAAFELSSELFPTTQGEVADRVRLIIGDAIETPAIGRQVQQLGAEPKLADTKLDTEFAAEYLAGYLVRLPGFGRKRKTLLAGALRLALGHFCDEVRVTHRLWGNRAYNEAQVVIYKKSGPRRR
jgi:hypothetical protein